MKEMLGHEVPSPEAARQFLKQFHSEEKIEQAKQQRKPEQIAFIPEEADALSGLGEVNRELVRELEQRIAAADQDATIIESHKQQALSTYCKKENPRLCRGGSRSLTVPGVRLSTLL